MKLNFSNPSRSYDVTRNSVRFSGYASIMEVEFFLEAEALKKLSPKLDPRESGYLQTFDTARERIYDVAGKAYVKDRKGSTVFVLKAGDF